MLNKMIVIECWVFSLVDVNGAAANEKSSLLKDLNRKRVVLASRSGTVITVRPGDILRIGNMTVYLCVCLKVVMWGITGHTD